MRLELGALDGRGLRGQRIGHRPSRDERTQLPTLSLAQRGRRLRQELQRLGALRQGRARGRDDRLEMLEVGLLQLSGGRCAACSGAGSCTQSAPPGARATSAERQTTSRATSVDERLTRRQRVCISGQHHMTACAHHACTCTCQHAHVSTHNKPPPHPNAHCQTPLIWTSRSQMHFTVGRTLQDVCTHNRRPRQKFSIIRGPL